jgi:hypothetical protein
MDKWMEQGRPYGDGHSDRLETDAKSRRESCARGNWGYLTGLLQDMASVWTKHDD